MSDTQPADSMLSITFLNMSSIAWSICGWGTLTGTTTQYLTQSPPPTLGAHGYTAIIAIGDNMPALTGNMDIFCCWVNPANLQRFGVRIHDPGQFLGIGTSPYYYVMSDTVPSNWESIYPPPAVAPYGNGMSDINWQSVAENYTQYQWTGISGVTITASPTVGDNRLFITVNISDDQSP
jgi:hypothetical protein